MKIFYLPDLGEGLAEAEVREWYVKEGDWVKTDQPLVSMETAKAVVDVPSPYTGKLVKLHGKVNDIIKTGSPFITFEIETAEVRQDQGSVVGKLETSEKKWNESAVSAEPIQAQATRIKAVPAARVLAKQFNIDLSQVKPTGAQDLITVEDVKSFLSQSQPGSQRLSQAQALHGARRAMAQAMAQSHQDVVPVTIVEDADITGLPAQADITVLLLKAMAAAAKKETALNAWFDGKTLERQLMEEVHIAVAIDTPDGLFVPVIRHVQAESEQSLRDSLNRYKHAVRERSLSPADMQGYTLMLSNFGTIAGRYATPMVMPPAVAILGCGGSREIVMPRQGRMEIGRILPLSLTIDHRAVTGGEASRFLGAVVEYLNNFAK